MLKRITIVFINLLFCVSLGFSQEILVAEEFFKKLSDNYSTISSYIADFVIKKDSLQMKGSMIYKNPNLFLMEFVEPKDQVIAFDGKKLTIYVPDYSVIMTQEMGDSFSFGTSLGTKEGLSLLDRYYSVSYLGNADPVPIDEGSKEMVVKLKFNWLTVEEGYREIIMSISDKMLIRRIEAVTATKEELFFELLDIRLNEDVPVSRFEYTGPSWASNIDNFLSGSEE